MERGRTVEWLIVGFSEETAVGLGVAVTGGCCRGCEEGEGEDEDQEGRGFAERRHRWCGRWWVEFEVGVGSDCK